MVLYQYYSIGRLILTWGLKGIVQVRAAESIGFSSESNSDSGVGVLVSTLTPTPGPTPACLEWIALCNVQFLCIGHSYARHLIVGQVKLQTGPQRDDPTWTRPGPDRSGDCTPSIITEPFFAIALDQRKTIFEPSLSRAPNHGHRVAGAPDTLQISGPGWVWVRNFDRLPSLLCRTVQGLVRNLSSSQSTTKICAEMT